MTDSGATSESADGRVISIPARVLLAATASILLVVLILQAGSYANAYSAQYRVHTNIDSWYKSTLLPTAEQWTEAETTIKSAIELMPDNASLINTLGRLYEFRAFQMERSSISRELHALKAIIQFRKAATVSPAWVYPWLNLVQTKARAGQLDPEFTRAYFQATLLGPWERNAMPPLIELGLHAYGVMTIGQQKKVDSYIDKVANGEADYIAGALQSRGSKAAVCEQLKKANRRIAFEKLCN